LYRSKVGTPKTGKNVTKDLDLLAVKVPYGPFFEYANKHSTTQPPPPREKEYSEILMQPVRNATKNNNLSDIDIHVKITNMTDKDVNDGLIFTYDNGDSRSSCSNSISIAYDVLFLFNQEYVTQTEYDNLKKFVANGGTIVFNDANVFNAEVKYNSTSDTVTSTVIDRGHAWQYDEKSGAAWRAERERWTNETME